MQTYANYTDYELALLMKENDQAAYTELYTRYKGLLYLHACRMLQDREEAKDVVQELFAYLWIKRKELEFRTGFSAYLYAAVRNRVLDRISRRKLKSDYVESLRKFAGEADHSTYHQLFEKELAALIEEEIEALPAKMRQIFELSRRQHLSYKEIAAQLIISDKTVKKQVSNALRILRLKLDTLFFTFIYYLFLS